MNTAAFANRLSRDLNVKSLTEITADGRQEILDAINGTLQRFHDISPNHSKTGTASITIDAPETVSIGVTQGSTEITGLAFTANSFYRTIRIDGDVIDNQIIGETTLAHPYMGVTGTVSAIVYSDVVILPDTFAEVVSDFTVLETETIIRSVAKMAYQDGRKKSVSRPEWFWVEPNSRNLSPAAGSILIRFNSLPDRDYRLECEAVMAPLRVTFSDLLTPHTTLPIRDQHVESYLYPVTRAALTESSLWRDKETISRINTKAEDAEKRYAIMVPQYAATPNNRVRTRRGF